MQMEAPIRANAIMEKSMAVVSRSGQTLRGMRACGRTIRPMESVHWCMPMVTYMKACGLTTRHMDMVRTGMQMEQPMSEIGSRISSMDRVWRHGPMAHGTTAATRTGKRTERERLPLPTAPYTLVPSCRTKSAGRAGTSGPIAKLTPARGKRIRCTAAVCSNGPMESSMKATLSMISGKAWASSNGKMDESTMENGKMESSTVGALSSRSMARKKLEFGRTAAIFNGSKRVNTRQPIELVRLVYLANCQTSSQNKFSDFSAAYFTSLLLSAIRI